MHIKYAIILFTLMTTDANACFSGVWSKHSNEVKIDVSQLAVPNLTNPDVTKEVLFTVKSPLKSQHLTFGEIYLEFKSSGSWVRTLIQTKAVDESAIANIIMSVGSKATLTIYYSEPSSCGAEYNVELISNLNELSLTQ